MLLPFDVRMFVKTAPTQGACAKVVESRLPGRQQLYNIWPLHYPVEGHALQFASCKLQTPNKPK
jgi:hypothetical protein